MMAQSATPTAGTAPAARAEEKVTTLAPFEVRSTQGGGYITSNAGTGFKTNEVLLKIPQAVMQVTRDMIDDTGGINSSDVLQFAGVSNFFVGEAYSMRGARINYALLDEMPQMGPYLDNINTDSYTVLRGPAATLYLNVALAGAILKVSKFPLAKPQYSITARVGQFGSHRTEMDFTGPLGGVGEAKFSYRLVGGVQGGGNYFNNVKDDRTLFHPTVEMNYKDTSVKLAFDYQQILHYPNANGFVTPTGELYTGAGRKEMYVAPDSMSNYHYQGVRLIATQRISDNWDMKIAASRSWWYGLAGITYYGGGLSWVTKTIGLTARRNEQRIDYSVAQLDLNGKYHVGGLLAQTTLGASYDEELGVSRFWVSPTFGTQTISMSDPHMELIKNPKPNEYTAPANPGSQGTTYRGNAYVQQTIELLPDRLTLLAGITSSKIKSNNVTDLRLNPPAVVTKGRVNLHRYGIVYNVTKEMALYAMESTTFSPTNLKDTNQNILPPVEGKAQEVGFKTALFNGKINSTFSVFKMALTNQASVGGVNAQGQSFYVPIGSTTQKGFDMDVSYTPFPGLQIIATYFKGKVRDQAGNRVGNTYSGDISLLVRYDVQGESLKGLGFGVGFSRISGRVLGVGAYNIGIPGQTFIEAEPGNLVNLFATYKLNQHWHFRAHIENALDEAYAAGAQISYGVDPSTPRNLTLSTTYKF